MIFIRSEKAEDIPAIRKVNEAAFDTGAEADLVDILRDSRAYALSLVALDNDKVVGHILFSLVIIESNGSKIPALGLAPMAVLPDYQRQGIGSSLVERGFDACRSKGHSVIVVLGHPDYYPRFGFVPSVRFSIRSEYDVPPEVFMIKELQIGVLKGKGGVAKYHRAFVNV